MTPLNSKIVKTGIALAAMVLLGGCAYFNLLYNAQTAFDAARQADSKQATADSVANALPSAEASGLYKRAIEKATKVFEIYPKDRRWHDDAVFLIARSNFYLRDNVAAIRRFKQLQQQYPGSPFIPRSYVLLGAAYLADDNFDKAEETILYALKTWPHLNGNEDLSLMLAQIAVRRQGKSMAIDILIAAQKKIRDPLARMEIALQIAALYSDLHNYPAAIAILRAAPRKNEQPELLVRIDLALVRALRAQQLFAEGLTLADRVLTTNPPIRFRNALLFEKAGLLAGLKRYDEALAVFAKVTTGDSLRLGGEAYFEQGELYLHIKADYIRALEKYTLALPRLPDSVEHKAVAKRRIAAINKIVALQTLEKEAADTAVASDTTKKRVVIPFGQSFDAAEMFWHDLNEPDSAYRRFLLLAADSTADSGRGVPRALYAAATVLRSMLGDTVRADSVLHIILVRFGVSEYAKRAAMDLGDSLVILTRSDSSVVAYRAAEKLFFDSVDTVGAVAAFLNVYSTYRDCEVAPQALYSAAWINDKIFGKNVSARSQYQELCDSFPNSDWCLRGAKARLKFVEDTLAVLRARKKISDPKKAVIAPAVVPQSTEGVLEGDTTAPDSTAVLPSDSVAAKPQPRHRPGSTLMKRPSVVPVQRDTLLPN